MNASDEHIPDERARAIWHRAAQLQAEAAQRLEGRSRLLASQGDAAAHEGSGFRRSEIEAAATEAGISPELVRVALAELGDWSVPAVRLEGWQDRAATRLLGVRQRSLGLARTIQAAPREVFAAMQRIFPASPYLLTLRDSVGDPLDGGVLLFDLPEYSLGTGVLSPVAHRAAAIDLKQIRVTLRPLDEAGQPPCEVVIRSHMHHGVRRNWRFGATLSGVAGAGGAAGGAAIGLGALALTGGLVILPAVAGAALGGGSAPSATGQSTSTT